MFIALYKLMIFTIANTITKSINIITGNKTKALAILAPQRRLLL